MKRYTLVFDNRCTVTVKMEIDSYHELSNAMRDTSKNQRTVWFPGVGTIDMSTLIAVLKNQE